jgi:hypothetical protein
MGNKPISCLDERQTAVIDNFFGKIGRPPAHSNNWNDRSSLSQLAGDESQVCVDDVAAVLNDCFTRDDCWKPFAEKLEYLYYKEDGRLKTDNSWWRINPYSRSGAKWHSKDAAKILLEQVRGYANLSDAERARTGRLGAARKEAKEFFLKECSVGNLKKGDEPSDDKLCKLIVDTISGKKCGWAPEKAGYNLVYLDVNNRYKEKVLSYVFANPGALRGYELREVLSLYGMMTSAGIGALYKKYPNTPLQVWFLFTDLEGIGPLYLEMLKSNKFSTADKIGAYEDLKYAKSDMKTDEVCEAAFAIIESAEKKEDLVDYTLIKAMANCDQIDLPPKKWT